MRKGARGVTDESEGIEATLSCVFEDFGAEHVRVGRVRQGGIIQHGQGFADGGVLWVAGGDVDWCADGDHVKDFVGGLDGHADAAVGAGVGFYKTPVHAVSGGVE